MPTEAAQRVEETTLAHYNSPVNPTHSLPAAESLINRLKVGNYPVPLPVQRFMDRMHDPKGNDLEDKLARDVHSRPDFKSLPPEKQSGISGLAGAIRWHSPARRHPYNRMGLTFAEGRNILVQTYRELAKSGMPSEIQHGLYDFSTGLERDLEEAAKRGGFFQEFGQRLKDLREEINKRR